MTVNVSLFLHVITLHKRLWFLINGLSSFYTQVEVPTKHGAVYGSYNCSWILLSS